MDPFTGLSVVIPTVDEKDTIKQVISVICDSCAPGDITEFIVVCSAGSSEEYITYLQTLAGSFPGIGFKVFRQNSVGPNAAIYEGFTQASGSHIMNIVADLENDPSDAGKMLRIVKEHPEATVTASRYLCENGYDNYSKRKKRLNLLFNRIVRCLFHSGQTDITYLYQCTPSYIMREFDFSRYKDNFILALALTPDIYSLPVIEIPSKVGKRSFGSSHLSLRYYFNFIKGILSLSFFKPKRSI